MRRALEAAADRLLRDADATAEISVGQRRADAIGLVAESALAAELDRGSAGDRYQVVVHVDETALASQAPAGQSAIEDPDGLHVSAETSGRAPCEGR